MPLSATLGCDVNDTMSSFYMRAQGGFDTEYGWHGRLIDPVTWVTTTSLAVSNWGHEWSHHKGG